MHAFLHKSRRENHRRVVFTQQDTIYSCAHLVLTNLLITSLLVLCFSQWFLLFLPPKFLLISCRPIDSYSDICYLGTDELIIFVSFLWMIWVHLPFLIYLFIYLFYSHAHLKLTNLLITSLLVLCFSQWFLLSLPPKILLISCHPRLLFWYFLFRYRWAHHLCFLSMNDLSQSSFFNYYNNRAK